MKTKFFFIVLLLIFISLTLASSKDCYDSDGKDFSVKGTTTGIFNLKTNEIETKDDYCMDDERLLEYICVTTPSTGETVVSGWGETCAYGCKDGACLANSEGRIERKIIECFDSDGKDGYSEKGYVTLKYDDGHEEKFWDSCGYPATHGKKGYEANDYFCGMTNNGPSYWASTTECMCEEGICIESRINFKGIDSPKAEVNDEEIRFKINDNLEVAESRTGEDVKIYAESTKATTSEKVTVTSEGINVDDKKIINPDEALTPIKDEIKVSNKEIVLKKENDELSYEIEGKKTGRLLWIFPVELDSKVEVDAVTNSIKSIKTNKPKWYVGS